MASILLLIPRRSLERAEPAKASAIGGDHGIRSGLDMVRIEGARLYKDSVYEVKRRQSLRARYVYGFIFFATNLLAWFIRDYGAKVLHGLHRRFFPMQILCVCQFRTCSLRPCHELYMDATFSAYCAICSDLQMCRFVEQGTPSASTLEECFG